MQYALLCYGTTNLGDEIQSIAARQFLPSCDMLVDRDRPNHMPDDAAGPCKIILNGWHTHNPENWPPTPDLIALLVSVHITNEVHARNVSGQRPAEALLEGANLDYLRAHGPVGARDLWTLDLLRAKNVESYFSACLTLTLGQDRSLPRHDYVCAVDLPAPSLALLRERVRRPVIAVSHADPAPAPFADRARRAGQLLSLYAHANCVVTTRLHCALPCLALQTPVLLIVAARDTYRFSGLRELVRNCTPENFLSGRSGFDPNDPSPNGDAYRPYRHALIRAVNRFVDAGHGADDEPPYPFLPETDVDALVAAEQMSELRSAAAREPRQAFQRIFQSGRDYSNFSRPDFLRELAKMHWALGDPDEAKRLLEIAHGERPDGPGIKKLLDDVSLEISGRMTKSR